jgi:phage FluMu protein Com
MGFNRRKMEDQRRAAAQKEATTRRSTDAQVLEDAERLIAAWNERQAERMPMLFSPTIGAAIAAGFWFLWVRCPACRTINAIDLRTLDRHGDAAVKADKDRSGFLQRKFIIEAHFAERKSLL